MRAFVFTALPIVLLAGACSDDPAPSGATDAGLRPDAQGSPDAGATDAHTADASGEVDAGALDAGALDAGPPDSGVAPGRDEVPVAGGRFSLVRDGLFGGSVLSLARSPAETSRIYAGSDGAGLFRSDDGGDSWQPTALDVFSVPVLGLHPTDPDTLWLLRQGARTEPSYTSRGPVELMRSTDGGASFSLVALPAAFDGVRWLAVSEAAVWVTGYVGTEEVAYRSTDEGQTWLSTALSMSSVQGIVAHPRDPDVAWIWAHSGVLRTGDGGATATDVTPALAGNGEFVYGLAGSPASGLRLWLGIANGPPFRSDDGGLTWRRLESAGGRTHELYPSPTNPDVLWATEGRGPPRISADGGASFTQVSLPRMEFQSTFVRLAPLDATEALAFGHAHEIARTKDAGATWRRSVEGFSATWIRDVAVSPAGDRIVLGSDHGDVFASDDGGRTWRRSRAGLVPLAVTAVAIDPRDPDVVYAGTGDAQGSTLLRTNFRGALFKSVDGGRTFARLTAPRGEDWAVSIEAIVVGPDRIVFVREGRFGARSADGGLSWSPLDPAGVLTDVRPDAAGAASHLVGYASGSRAYYAVSSDLGSSWTPFTDAPRELGLHDVVRVRGSRVDPLVQYAFTDSAFTRYSGSAWARAEVGLGVTGESRPERFEFAVAAGGSGSADHLVAASLTRGPGGSSQWALHISADGAATWRTHPIDFVGVPTAVAFAEQTGDVAAIALAGGRGLLVTRTGGQ